MLKPFIEFKYVLITIYDNYKESDIKLKFFLLYLLSTLLILFYFLHIMFFFPIIFSYVLISGLITLFWNKQPFMLTSMFLYKCCGNYPTIYLIKYYLCDILIQYSYSFLYIILKTVCDKLWLNFIKFLFIRSFNILFIMIFGFPAFLLKLVNKIYGRINNSIERRKIYWNILFMNINSMFFFDFSENMSIEEYTIKYDNCRFYFN